MVHGALLVAILSQLRRKPVGLNNEASDWESKESSESLCLPLLSVRLLHPSLIFCFPVLQGCYQHLVRLHSTGQRPEEGEVDFLFLSPLLFLFSPLPALPKFPEKKNWSCLGQVLMPGPLKCGEKEMSHGRRMAVPCEPVEWGKGNSQRMNTGKQLHRINRAWVIDLFEKLMKTLDLRYSNMSVLTNTKMHTIDGIPETLTIHFKILNLKLLIAI